MFHRKLAPGNSGIKTIQRKEQLDDLQVGQYLGSILVYLFQHLELEEQLVLSLRAQHPLAVGCGPLFGSVAMMDKKVFRNGG